MSDLNNKERKTGRLAAGLAAGLIAAAVGVGVIVGTQTADTQPAQAHAMTSVRNGTTSKYLPIYVIRDSGLRNVVSEGRTVWGVKALAVQSGTCVRLNGGTPICSTSGWKTVPLALGSYVAVRTK